MKNKWVRNVIFVVALAVFLYSAYQLFIIFAEYQKGEKEYDTIVEEVITEEVVEVTEGEKTKEEVVFKVDFDTLLKTNKETVAWIRFEQPEKISYPVVHTTDNDKYLKTTFELKKNASGALFVDAINAPDFTDRNTFVYGHNMKNGSMFGQLKKYRSKDFYQENPYFYIYTPDGKELKYQVFAVGIVEDTSESYRRTFTDDADFLKYLGYLKKVSRYDTGVEVNETSQIVSLSTCTNVTDTQRLVVHGVKISERIVGE